MPANQPVIWDEHSILLLERTFKNLTIEGQYADEAYAQKTWAQSRLLKPDNRTEFFRKVALFNNWARSADYNVNKKCRVLFAEIAGFINDRGSMEKLREQSNRDECEE